MIIKALSKELLHCTCGASMSVPGTPATCDTGTQELYLSSLVSPPTVSSYRRRSRIAEEIKAQANSHVFCPPGLSACSIANSTDPDAYECLNTNIELGGCAFLLSLLFADT
jgi:hypothetical protein